MFFLKKYIDNLFSMCVIYFYKMDSEYNCYSRYEKKAYIFWKNTSFLSIHSGDCRQRRRLSSGFARKNLIPSSRKIVFWLHFTYIIIGISFSVSTIVRIREPSILDESAVSVAKYFETIGATNSVIRGQTRKQDTGASWGKRLIISSARSWCIRSDSEPSSRISPRKSIIRCSGRNDLIETIPARRLKNQPL